MSYGGVYRHFPYHVVRPGVAAAIAIAAANPPAAPSGPPEAAYLPRTTPAHRWGAYEQQRAAPYYITVAVEYTIYPEPVGAWRDRRQYAPHYRAIVHVPPKPTAPLATYAPAAAPTFSFAVFRQPDLAPHYRRWVGPTPIPRMSPAVMPEPQPKAVLVGRHRTLAQHIQYPYGVPPEAPRLQLYAQETPPVAWSSAVLRPPDLAPYYHEYLPVDPPPRHRAIITTPVPVGWSRGVVPNPDAAPYQRVPDSLRPTPGPPLAAYAPYVPPTGPWSLAAVRRPDIAPHVREPDHVPPRPVVGPPLALYSAFVDVVVYVHDGALYYPYNSAYQHPVRRPTVPLATYQPPAPVPWSVAVLRRPDIAPYLRPELVQPVAPALVPALVPVAAPTWSPALLRRADIAPYVRYAHVQPDLVALPPQLMPIVLSLPVVEAWWVVYAPTASGGIAAVVPRRAFAAIIHYLHMKAR